MVLIIDHPGHPALVMYLYGLSLRKIDGNEGSLVIVAMPLSSIIQQQLTNPYCPILTLSMTAQVSGTSSEAVGEAQVCSTGSAQPESDGDVMAQLQSKRYVLLFTHPEALATKKGLTLLKFLARNKLLHGIIADEIHQGMSDHWEQFRPSMLRPVFSARVHAVPGSPVGAFTATITPMEKEKVVEMAGRRGKMLVIAQGPVNDHAKIVTLRRPTSQVPFLGRLMSDGSRQAGLLDLLRLLILDKFVAVVKGGREGWPSFKKTMIFFRSGDLMTYVNCWLISQTGYRWKKHLHIS